MKFKNLMTLLVCLTLVFSQSAFAARIGGGKSYGMQRSNISHNNQQRYNQPSPQQAAPQAAPQQQRPGMGAGTAAMLGAAAGAAGGYMLGKSMNSNNGQTESGQGMQAQGSTFPWGTIGILAILLFLGLMLFRRSKANLGLFGNSNQINPAANNFSIPTINRTGTTTDSQGITAYTAPPQNMPDNMDKMPDGIETMYFLRQVKGMFLHIQSMNNPDNVAEVEKYMTPGLYQEIKNTITANNFVADFSTLDCQLLNSEVNGNQLIASVKFFGMVSEEPNQPSKPFSEIWNFIKTDLATGKWLVSGIQQETLN